MCTIWGHVHICEFVRKPWNEPQISMPPWMIATEYTRTHLNIGWKWVESRAHRWFSTVNIWFDFKYDVPSSNRYTANKSVKFWTNMSNDIEDLTNLQTIRENLSDIIVYEIKFGVYFSNGIAQLARTNETSSIYRSPQSSLFRWFNEGGHYSAGRWHWSI